MCKNPDKETETRIVLSEDAAGVQEINGMIIPDNHLHVFDQMTIGNNKILFPGQSGTSHIYITNNSDNYENYELTLTSENTAHIPMQFRIIQNNFISSESGSTWFTLDQPCVITGQIDGCSENLLCLEWRWNADDDSHDTEIGKLASIQNIWYGINFSIYVEENEPVAVLQSQSASAHTAAVQNVKTGDTGYSAVYFCLFLLSAGLLFRFLRRKRKSRIRLLSLCSILTLLSFIPLKTFALYASESTSTVQTGVALFDVDISLLYSLKGSAHLTDRSIEIDLDETEHIAEFVLTIHNAGETSVQWQLSEDSQAHFEYQVFEDNSLQKPVDESGFCMKQDEQLFLKLSVSAPAEDSDMLSLPLSFDIWQTD